MKFKNIRQLFLIVVYVAAVWAVPYIHAQSSISGIWVNDGEDKATQDELRASSGQTVTNALWDGTTIKLFGAKNEVINFNLILEAASTLAANVSVTMSNLNGPSGSVLRYAARPTTNLFDWTVTESELFYVRYLQILGLSGAPATWQEPTFPQRAQCPSGTGCPWTSRPVANKFYPDIAVPIELVPSFSIAAGNNQSIWADIYIPRTAAAGSYSGTVTISENGVATHTVPINLTVRNFTLPDSPSSKTMFVSSYADVSFRYSGVQWPNNGTPQDLLTKQVLQNELLVAHRHKISLIGDNFGQSWSTLQPATEWLPFLSGAAFTSSNGYAGPGGNTGQDVFSIGTYGGMTENANETQSAFTAQFNGWESWFETNSPSTERFVYLCDESACQSNTPTLATQLQRWQAIIGVGHNLHTLATQPLKNAVGTVLSNPTSTWPFSEQASSSDQTNANTILTEEPARRLYAYNGGRPGSGSMMIEDEGTAARELPWAQYKKQIDRFFFWETTYYNDNQNGRGNTDVFTTADTFGATHADSMYGQAGGNNGNGVLLYPGTDTVFPANSYGISGPIVSLRLKHWRRGIQDVDYLTLANAINPTAVGNLVSSMVPAAFWENQCFDLSDCTYFKGPVSWSNNPDKWESARSQLADIIAPLGGVTANLASSPTSIATGQSSTLTWSSTNANSCTGTNFSTGNATSGSATVSPTTTTTYTVTCSGTAGSASANATVTVTTAPTANLTANPASIKSGQSSTLTWSSTNASSCTGTNFSTGNASSGSATVAPVATTTYSISCMGTTETVSASTTVAIANGLQGSWLLDEGSGTTTADSSGNGNTGTLSGSPLPTWTTGVTGDGLAFSGSGGFVSIPSSASLNNLQSRGGGGMTIVAWVYPTSSNPNQIFLDKQVWTFGFFGSGAVIFSHVCSSGQVQAYTASNSVPFNQWSQIVATWTGSASGSSMAIYLNGTPITRNSQDCSGTMSDDSSYPLTLGGTFYNRNPFAGSLDDIRVYSRVLSATEISGLYNGTATATLTVNPTTIVVGQSSALTWSSTNASSCTGTNFSTGSSTSGTVTVFPTTTTTYSVTCTGTSGTVSASGTVAVSSGAASPIIVSASGPNWESTRFGAQQTGNFTVEVDAIPLAPTIDGGIGLSNGPQTAFTGLACIGRFNQSGFIDARNGGSYAAANSIPYAANQTYHFRFVVSLSNHTYSLFVTPSGQPEQTIASNYAFRTEQQAVTVLNSWSMFADAGSMQVFNFLAPSATAIANSVWTNSSFPVQVGSFQAQWDAMPTATTMDGVMALSNGPQTAFTGFACLIRFTDGTIQARNGSGYAADISFSYTPNVMYHFRVVVNLASHSYSVYVTPAGGSEQRLANSYAFRTEQASVTALNNAGIIVDTSTGSLRFGNFAVTSAYDQTILADSPVAFWSMNPIATTEPDLTGNGNTGTYQGGTPGLGTMPNGEQVAVFNGAAEYLSIPSSASFSIPTTGNLTWEMWIQPAVLNFPNSFEPDGYVNAMGKCATHPNTGMCEWQARMYDTTTLQGRCNRLSAYVFNPNGEEGSGADWQPVCGLIQAGEWLHVVGEYTTNPSLTPSDCTNGSTYPGTINIWVNGVPWNQAVGGQTGCMGQFDVVPQATSSLLNIGTVDTQNWFDGAIGKVAVYNYLLSQTQITNHYEAMTGLQPTGSCGGQGTCTF